MIKNAITDKSEISDAKHGKFNTPEALLAAYNALESEFTKRCQLIKKLQAELDARSDAQAESKVCANGCGSPDRDMSADVSQSRKSGSNEIAVPDGCSENADDVIAAAEENRAGETAAAEENRAGETAAAEVSAADSRAEADKAGSDGGACSNGISAEDALDYIVRNAADCADALAEIPDIAAVCIARYKRRLAEPLPAAAPCGSAVMVPVKRPRTLAEAKLLADGLLSG